MLTATFFNALHKSTALMTGRRVGDLPVATHTSHEALDGEAGTARSPRWPEDRVQLDQLSLLP
ncbi:MAG TPA: hypothetical protein VGG16_22180, partial [Streptosporangiaceae bacterium]